jgi:hypothetical protein
MSQHGHFIRPKKLALLKEIVHQMHPVRAAPDTMFFYPCCSMHGVWGSMGILSGKTGVK